MIIIPIKWLEYTLFSDKPKYTVNERASTRAIRFILELTHEVRIDSQLPTPKIGCPPILSEGLSNLVNRWIFVHSAAQLWPLPEGMSERIHPPCIRVWPTPVKISKSCKVFKKDMKAVESSVASLKILDHHRSSLKLWLFLSSFSKWWRLHWIPLRLATWQEGLL